MKITADFTRLSTGENLTRGLDISVEEEYSSSEVRLGFVTPMGRLYVTDVIELTDNCGRFLIPDFLLDGKGKLLAQILLNGEKGIIAKSKIEEYPVYLSLDDMRLPTASDGLYTLTRLFAFIAEKADKEHTHEGVYCTENEIRELISVKSDITHDHSDLYLTREQAEELLAAVDMSGHNHDERYYSREETDSLLEGKCDSTHNHDDLYFNKNDVDYIVEQGVSDKWKYRKWNSGFAECWRHVTQAPNTALSGGESFKIAVPYPFTFSETPSPFISQQSLAARIGKFYQQNVVKTSLVINVIVEEGETLGINDCVSFQVLVKGKWK